MVRELNNFFVSCFGMHASKQLILFGFFIPVVYAFIGCSGCNNKDASSSGGAKPILLLNGTGISTNDVAAIQGILESKHLSYSTVNSSALNVMSQSEIMRHRLLIVPGGNFMVMGNSLTKGGAANIHLAVQHGLNYLGICAGAFLAGNSAYYNGLNLTSGVTFGFYSAENQGLHKTKVAISSPEAPTLDQYWEDGPQLSGWGMVVAKYPDNTPAVAEGKCGSGYVILAAIHAEAPAGWRQGLIFKTPASTDNAYAAKLISAALNGVILPHY